MCSWANAKLWVRMYNAKEHFCCSLPQPHSPAPTQLCLNYTVLTLTVFLYSGCSCYFHPQPGSAILLLIMFAWVLGDTQASRGFSSLKSKSSSYFGAMPAVFLWWPVQMEIIQLIQKEVFCKYGAVLSWLWTSFHWGKAIIWTIGPECDEVIQENLSF